jgi:two-component system phosphate regulon sensor histidine kinase PhoR
MPFKMFTRPIQFTHIHKLLLAVAASAVCFWPLTGLLRTVLDQAPPPQGVNYDALMPGSVMVALGAGCALALAVAFWQLCCLLVQRPGVARRAAGVPRGAKLALSAALAVGALAVPVSLFAEVVGHAHRYEALSPSLRRSLNAACTPVWTPLAAMVTAGMPPVDMPIAGQHVEEALRRMAAYPYVDIAFHVSPDGQLRMRGETPQARHDTPVDLHAWVPTLEVKRRLAYLSKAPAAPIDRERYQRERRIQQIVDRLGSGSTANGNQFSPTFLEGQEQSVVFFKGNRHHGYYGYFLDAKRLAQDADPLLARFGLARDLDVVFYQGPPTYNPLFRPAQRLPAPLGAMRLTFSGYADGHFVTRETARLFLAALLGAALGGFALALLFGQIRAFLDDRAVALAQSNFVSAVSHEMRTPLTTIKMYAEMVEQGVITDPERRATYMGIIAKECDRLSRLIENVLDYAQISGRRRAYRFEPADMRGLIDEALAALEAPIAQAGLAVEVDAPEGLSASVDRDAVVQAIVNLVGNAAKYAASGGRVRITARAEGAAVSLTVQDFGPGIPREEQRKVFRAFYRVGSEATRTASGTGLGLALVKAHAEAHHGRLELESAQGEGSTFRLVLPIERKAA